MLFKKEEKTMTKTKIDCPICKTIHVREEKSVKLHLLRALRENQFSGEKRNTPTQRAPS